MSGIEKFIEDVENERFITLYSGIMPSDVDGSGLKRLHKKFPELKIDLEKERRIIIHTRASFNAENN